MFRQAEAVDPAGSSPADISGDEPPPPADVPPAREQAAESPVDLPASVAEILSRVQRH
jgi:hypothetical protein